MQMKMRSQDSGKRQIRVICRDKLGYFMLQEKKN